MDKKTKFLKICADSLREKGLDSDKRYVERLKYEIKYISVLEEFDYFLDLYKKCKEEGLFFSENENNTLVSFLLGITDNFDIDRSVEFIQGDFPDIDVDYLKPVRDYLKNDWSKRIFGTDNVCSIGNYTTFGLKSSLIDMVRVHGKDRGEILKITTKMGLKDDEGKQLSFEKALEMYPELKDYCDENPDVALAAKRLLNRNRGMGTHAGGLIISNARIDNLVPLVKGSDGSQVSAFVEGLHGTDLGPLGLIKFDLLVLSDLMRIVECCKLVKERNGLKNICSFPNQDDFSDTSYLNDEKALSMANEGKLKGIFQFDSDGIREMVRSGGVTSFEDLAAYSALYRPGPIMSNMHKSFIKRKKNEEEYEIEDALKPILSNTYGVQVYQEQVTRILNVIGGVPLVNCEKVRKAISKKDEKVFSAYKDQFIDNGKLKLGLEEERVVELWDQVLKFSEYGFNKCLSEDAEVKELDTNSKKFIKDLENGDKLYSWNKNDKSIILNEVEESFETGEQEVFEVCIEDDFIINCTKNHKFLCRDGNFYKIEDIFEKNLEIVVFEDINN